MDPHIRPLVGPLLVTRKKPWLCRCGTRNPRTTQKCECGSRRPKARVPKHARTLRDDNYETYKTVNATIHGVSDESCGVCNKPRSQERKHDRDHDHRTGMPRGLACSGNRGCNILMVPWVTAAAARGIAEAKAEAGEPDAERWSLIAKYLSRVEDHYATDS